MKMAEEPEIIKVNLQELRRELGWSRGIDLHVEEFIKEHDGEEAE